MAESDKGKPGESRGRKATGLRRLIYSVMLAGLPGRATEIAYPGYAPPFICLTAT